MKYHWFLSLFLFSSASALAQSPLLKAQTNQQLGASVADIEVSIKGINKDLKRVTKLLDNKAMMSLFQRLEEVSQDVSELRGQVEEQGHLQQSLQKRQRELYLDLDRRMREMELNASSQAKTIVPINVPNITPVVEAPITSNTVAPVTPPKVAVKPATAAVKAPVVKPVIKQPAKQPVKPVVKQPMSKERADYQKAFDLLKEGRYNNAKVSFKTFLLKYPDSSYAGNAQYWSGEANYVTRKFNVAMIEFKRVITQYPASNKVPDAMLKLGYTFYETRQMDHAKQILNELVKRFPKSTAARLAGKRLKRMSREGL